MNYVTIYQAAELLDISYWTLNSLVKRNLIKKPFHFGGKAKFFEKEYIEELKNSLVITKEKAGRPKSAKYKPNLHVFNKGEMYNHLMKSVEIMMRLYEKTKNVESYSQEHEEIKEYIHVYLEPYWKDNTDIAHEIYEKIPQENTYEFTKK